VMPRAFFHIPGYGSVTVTCGALDVTMVTYLPASPNDLRKIIEERSDVVLMPGTPLSALLAILADFDHNVDGSLLRAYA
jgi:hypothetical protein